MPIDFKLLSDPDWRKEQEEKRKQLEEAIEKEEADYSKRLTECRNSSRLSDWEISFLSSLEVSFKRNIQTRFVDLSEKQQNVLLKIEKKVHAAG